MAGASPNSASAHDSTFLKAARGEGSRGARPRELQRPRGQAWAQGGWEMELSGGLGDLLSGSPALPHPSGYTGFSVTFLRSLVKCHLPATSGEHPALSLMSLSYRS